MYNYLFIAAEVVNEEPSWQNLLNLILCFENKTNLKNKNIILSALN